MAPVLALLRANALARARQHMLLLPALNADQQAAVLGVQWQVERGKVASVGDFSALSGEDTQTALTYIDDLAGLVGTPASAAIATNGNERVYRRNPKIKGPMHAFGYSYIEEHLPADEYAGLKLTGTLAYEALNLVDGKRTVAEIHDWLLAECGAECVANSGLLTAGDVADYLAALENIGVVF